MEEVGESPASHAETGSLTQPSPHESRFIGSSSGVYFITTVQKAFKSSRETSHLPAAEDTVGGEDDFAPSTHNSPQPAPTFELNIDPQHAVHVTIASSLGSLPSADRAQQLAIDYFTQWHPILPFLSGPAFLQDLHEIYQNPTPPSRVLTDKQKLSKLVILQCVLATASPQYGPHTFPTRSNLLPLVASLANTHDIITIQALLAAQVYCVSTLALRTASSIGGLLCKLLFHAGLHRCPYRYPQLSNEDRDLRKRILWSAYAIDRYLCQALGIPVSISDAEIDVCLSGRREMHGLGPTDRNGVLISSLRGPDTSASINPITASGQSNEYNSDSISPLMGVNKLEVILANFVEYGRLVGRVMELFHVSLHSRKNDPKKVLFLRSDVNKWFNSMPEEHISTAERDPADEQTLRFLPFLHVLYEQLEIMIHRPSLSLPRSTPEFHHSLQVTIRAAKRTISAMERQPILFWPGYVASVWMSGLIIAFACQISMYNTSQGSQEIVRCLDLLKRMSERWRSAQRCHAALSTLLSDLSKPTSQTSTHENSGDDIAPPRAKRQRLDPGYVEQAEFTTISTSSTSPSELPSKTIPPPAQHPGGYPSTFASAGNAGEWDVTDYFHDISWENLFDISDTSQNVDMNFFAR